MDCVCGIKTQFNDSRLVYLNIGSLSSLLQVRTFPLVKYVLLVYNKIIWIRFYSVFTSSWEVPSYEFGNHDYYVMSVLSDFGRKWNECFGQFFYFLLAEKDRKFFFFALMQHNEEKIMCIKCVIDVFLSFLYCHREWCEISHYASQSCHLIN